MHTVKRLCKDTAGMQPSACHGEKPQEKPTLLITLILDLQPPELQEIHFSCLSLPPCDILLWQPKQTKTSGEIGVRRSETSSPTVTGGEARHLGADAAGCEVWEGGE